MTVDGLEKDRTLMLGDKPMSSALQNPDLLAEQLVAHYAKTLPAYTTYEMEQIRDLLTTITRGGLQMSVALLDSGRLPSEEDLAGMRALAIREAQEGVPLDAVLSVAHEALGVVQQLLLSNTCPKDFDDAQEGTQRFFTLATVIHTAVSTAYTEGLKSITADEGTATNTLVNALLSGKNPEAVAAQLGIDLAPEYLVLRIAVDLQSPSPKSGISHAIEVRRKLDSIQHEFAAHCGTPLLSTLTHQGGIVLLPGAPQWEWVRELVGLVGISADVEVTASGEQCATGEIPDVITRVEELLRLAKRLGRPAGLYGLADLAFEYQLTRPGPGRAGLIELLAPLDGSPELLQTLTVHIENDLNRQRTASLLHLHTNTVDYRMKRIAQLTGLDPTRPSGLRQLQAAIVAREFLNAPSPARR